MHRLAALTDAAKFGHWGIGRGSSGPSSSAPYLEALPAAHAVQVTALERLPRQSRGTRFAQLLERRPAKLHERRCASPPCPRGAGASQTRWRVAIPSESRFNQLESKLAWATTVAPIGYVLRVVLELSSRSNVCAVCCTSRTVSSSTPRQRCFLPFTS